MWRSICAILLSVSIVHAQSQLPGENRTLPVDNNNETLATKATIYRYYSELREGTTEQIAVGLFTAYASPTESLEDVIVFPQGIKDGATYLVSPTAKGPEIVPSKLELQALDGFVVTSMRNPKGKDQRFAFSKAPVSVVLADCTFHLKVRGKPDVSLGTHVLRGSITLQFVNDAGLSVPQKLKLEIPITVVDHDAKVKRDTWPVNLNTEAPGTHAWAIPLMVLIAPLWILYGLVCHLAGNCTD